MAQERKGRLAASAALFAAAGLLLSGCGMLDDGGDDSDPSNGQSEEETDNPGEDDRGEPEDFPEDLPRFWPEESIEGSADEEPWEGVLVVEEQTFVILDARHDVSGGGRSIEVVDAYGELVVSADERFSVDAGGVPGDPGVMLDLEPGEYLVSLPVLEHPTWDYEAEDFVLQAYVPPVIDVGDTVDVQIRPFAEQQEELADGQMFGIRLPEDGTYTFETSSDELEAHVSLYSSPGQERASDFINNDTRGLLEDEFPAGSYTVLVSNPDAESGAATLAVSGG